jgi:AAHS family 4-hydroxybenzoate transporter-like MFS transporter
MKQIEARSSAQLVSDVIDNGRVSGQQLLVIGLCFLFNMVDGFDITAMAIVASPVASELSISADRLGWIFSFALAGMMIGAMLLAPISDIIGRRSVIILSLVLVGISILLTANASSLLEFFIFRFVAGLGAGTLFASQATLADEYSPGVYRTLSVAIVTSGYPAGAMMTSVVAGMIMPEYGWRGMFWFGGSVTIAMVVVALLFIPESLKYLFKRRPKNTLERTNKILRKLGKDVLDAMPTVTVEEQTNKAGLVATMMKLVAPQYRSTTLQLWAAFLMSFASLYFLMSWIPKLIEDSGFTAADGRQAFFLMNLGAICGVYVLGALSTRMKLTNLIAMFFLITSAGMIVYAMVPTKLSLLLTLIFFIGLFQQGGFTAMYSVAAKVYPTDMRSTGIGWAIGLGRSGAVIGPVVAGYLISAGTGMSGNFLLFALPMAVSAVLVYRLHIR